MATETSARVNSGCSVVCPRLTDVAIGDGPDFGAILIAVGC
jgi:hypothetical protein